MVNVLDSDTIIQSIATTFGITYAEARQMVSDRVNQHAFSLVWPVTSQSIPLDVSVSVSPGIPVPTADQTLFTVLATGTGAVQTLATVTAGKKAYVVALSSTDTANGFIALCNNAGTQISLDRYLANSNVQKIGIPLAEYTSGQAIKAQAAAATAHISVTYVEVPE